MVHLYIVLAYLVTGFLFTLYCIRDAYKRGFRRVLNPLSLILWLAVWVLWPFALYCITTDEDDPVC